MGQRIDVEFFATESKKISGMMFVCHCGVQQIQPKHVDQILTNLVCGHIFPKSQDF